MKKSRPDWDNPGEFRDRPNDLFYIFMTGRWVTLGGRGRDFSDVPADFMFPSNPGGSDANCQYCSECNSDGSGTDSERADRRFILSSGPFALEPGNRQQVAFAVVWARGKDNFDSVQKLKKADDMVQAAFDWGFEVPTQPAAPLVTATALDSEVILEWRNSSASNNYLESYRAGDPLARPGQDIYEFEGYTVYRYETAIYRAGRVIANYDVANGVTQILEAPSGALSEVTAAGSDHGVQSFHAIRGLSNYATFYFGVQANAYNEHSTPKVLRGPVSRVEVTPTRSPRVLPEASRVAAADPGADFHAEKLTGGDGEVWPRIVNPAAVEVGTHTVEFYALESGAPALRAEDPADGQPDPPLFLMAAKGLSQPPVTFDIKRDGEVVFDGNKSGEPVPQRAGIVVADGMEISVAGPDAGTRVEYLTSPYVYCGYLECSSPTKEVRHELDSALGEVCNGGSRGSMDGKFAVGLWYEVLP